jgi:hypothetical protein
MEVQYNDKTSTKHYRKLTIEGKVWRVTRGRQSKNRSTIQWQNIYKTLHRKLTIEGKVWWVTRGRQSKNGSTIQWQNIYKTLHRKLTIEGIHQLYHGKNKILFDALRKIEGSIKRRSNKYQTKTITLVFVFVLPLTSTRSS